MTNAPEYTVVSNYEIPERADGGGRFITFLVAPNIPTTELKALEDMYREIIADPRRSLVINYELVVFTVLVEPNARLIVTAPDIPPTALTELRKSVNDPLVDIIAVNYDLSAFAIPVSED